MPATEKSFNAEPAGDGDFSSRIAVACRLGVKQTCAHVTESDSIYPSRNDQAIEL